MIFFLTITGAALAIPLLCVVALAIRRNAAAWRPGELMEWPEEAHS